MKNVAVFFGGQSVEHDISVITGVLTLNALNREKYNAIPVYIHTDGKWYTGESLFDLDNFKTLRTEKLSKVMFLGGDNTLYKIKGRWVKAICPISVGINCLHGERGEDGSLSGLTNMCSIPLASPDILSSSVSMDKAFTKTVMRGLKIKTLPSVTVKCVGEYENVKSKIKYPVIIKPVRSGSSIGIKVAKTDAELKDAINYGLKFGDRVIAEPFLKDFIEINCACFNDGDGKVYVSELEQPVGRAEILTFSDKYENGKRIFPAKLDKELTDKIRSITKKIYQELNFSGVIRIDYLVVGETVYLNEINSVPGSLSYYLFCDTLSEFSTMLDKLISGAEKAHAKAQTFQKRYDSGVLCSFGSKGAKQKRQ